MRANLNVLGIIHQNIIEIAQRHISLSIRQLVFV
jgi:hypothetical protein